MRVIRSERLIEFAKKHTDARGQLATWLQVAETAHWKSIQDVRRTFPPADVVKVASQKIVTVFNIKGNRYRLVVAIDYAMQVFNVLATMTHEEYSRDLCKKKL